MTKIFKNFSEFFHREDKAVNGVTQEFANNNPSWDEEKNNKGCWNCSDCSDSLYCSDCSDCSRSSYSLCCSNCFRCSDCVRCVGCSGCVRSYNCCKCTRCSDCKNIACKEDLKYADPVDGFEGATAELIMKVPVIPGIHGKVLEAVKQPNALDMGAWHTCETTHCRAGWVVALAGDAGKKFEAQTSTVFAAMQIYHASCPKIPVSPTRFYEDNEKALADIERCAQEESKA
jgi:hypothetical protein